MLVRTFLFPRYVNPEELWLLDAPTASRFTIESVGGKFSEMLDLPPTSARPVVENGPTMVKDTLDEDDLLERGEAGKSRWSFKDIRRRASFRSEAGGAGDR